MFKEIQFKLRIYNKGKFFTNYFIQRICSALLMLQDPFPNMYVIDKFLTSQFLCASFAVNMSAGVSFPSGEIFPMLVTDGSLLRYGGGLSL